MTEILKVKPPEEIKNQTLWLLRDYPYLVQPILSIHRQVVEKGWNFSELCNTFGVREVIAFSNIFFVQGRSFQEMTIAGTDGLDHYTPSSVRTTGGSITLGNNGDKK